MTGEAYRHGRKTGNRAPLMSASVLRGFARLPFVVPAHAAVSEPDVAAALRYCAALAAFRNTPAQQEKRAKKSRASGTKRVRPCAVRHHDMIED